jgi:hypothetical protein
MSAEPGKSHQPGKIKSRKRQALSQTISLLRAAWGHLLLPERLLICIKKQLMYPPSISSPHPLTTCHCVLQSLQAPILFCIAQNAIKSSLIWPFKSHILWNSSVYICNLKGFSPVYWLSVNFIDLIIEPSDSTKFFPGLYSKSFLHLDRLAIELKRLQGTPFSLHLGYSLLCHSHKLPNIGTPLLLPSTVSAWHTGPIINYWVS